MEKQNQRLKWLIIITLILICVILVSVISYKHFSKDINNKDKQFEQLEDKEEKEKNDINEEDNPTNDSEEIIPDNISSNDDNPSNNEIPKNNSSNSVSNESGNKQNSNNNINGNTNNNSNTNTNTNNASNVNIPQQTEQNISSDNKVVDVPKEESPEPTTPEVDEEYERLKARAVFETHGECNKISVDIYGPEIRNTSCRSVAYKGELLGYELLIFYNDGTSKNYTIN